MQGRGRGRACSRLDPPPPRVPLSSLGRGGRRRKVSCILLFPSPTSLTPSISLGVGGVKSPLMCRAPPTLLNLLTGCEQGGIWPGCHSNCTGSSQTLGNPPLTLADLSPPQPADNGSARSGGPDAFQGDKGCCCRSSARPTPPAQPSWPQGQLSPRWPAGLSAQTRPETPTQAPRHPQIPLPLSPALTAPHQSTCGGDWGNCPTGETFLRQVKSE